MIFQHFAFSRAVYVRALVDAIIKARQGVKGGVGGRCGRSFTYLSHKYVLWRAWLLLSSPKRSVTRRRSDPARTLHLFEKLMPVKNRLITTLACYLFALTTAENTYATLQIGIARH